MSVVSFIVPVRHPANAKDWNGLKGRLQQTLSSIAAQRHGAWEGVVVANRQADLPPLPPNISAVLVDFPPNSVHDMGSKPLEDVYDAFRLDKGRRVLAGLQAQPDAQYIMIVDDDDFVSSNITQFVADNAGANGWSIDRGYRWSENGHLVYIEESFAQACGTSHIVRRDLYQSLLGPEPSTDSIKAVLGSHVKIGPILREKGSPLASLPFLGAVYRVGHPGAHSKSSGMLRHYIFNKKFVKRPRTLWRNARRLRRIDDRMRMEFFSGTLKPHP